MNDTRAWDKGTAWAPIYTFSFYRLQICPHRMKVKTMRTHMAFSVQPGLEDNGTNWQVMLSQLIWSRKTQK